MTGLIRKRDKNFGSGFTTGWDYTPGAKFDLLKIRCFYRTGFGKFDREMLHNFTKIKLLRFEKNAEIQSFIRLKLCLKRLVKGGFNEKLDGY